MKFLITGGLGHIGSYLARWIDKKHDITIVDNLSTQRYCSLTNMSRKFEFIDKCFTEIDESVIQSADVIVHLAAITNATLSFQNDDIEIVNKKLTKEFVHKCKNKFFIFPSSTSVYGVSKDIVYEDDESYINPQSPYAESKIYIESVIKKCCEQYSILRFGTIFGVSIGMRFHTAINKFCYQAAFNQPLTIWKDNYKKIRPYLGIKDACRAIEHIANSKILNQTYNVVTQNKRLDDIVAIINQIKNVEINFVDTPLLNQYSYIVSDKKIRETGYTPYDNMEEDIKHTIRLLS